MSKKTYRFKDLVIKVGAHGPCAADTCPGCSQVQTDCTHCTNCTDCTDCTATECHYPSQGGAQPCSDRTCPMNSNCTWCTHNTANCNETFISAMCRRAARRVLHDPEQELSMIRAALEDTLSRVEAMEHRLAAEGRVASVAEADHLEERLLAALEDVRAQRSKIAPDTDE